jgi:2-polyprenyl-6-methoxyphenol hydroxylase-like FAD-dependent oxidoreductase
MKPVEEGFYTYKILKHHADGYVADGVLLIGDAAHTTPPYYGMGMNMAMRDAHHAAKHIVPLLDAGEKPTRAALQPIEDRVRPFNEFVITASWLYGRVASAHHKSSAVVQEELKRSPALDPAAMSIIYGPYDSPPPTQGQIAALKNGTWAELTAEAA